VSGALGSDLATMHAEAAGQDPRAAGPAAHLLVVDPLVDATRLTAEMADRGVLTTVTGSTVDALVEFGRHRPTTVIVAPRASGISATAFVEAVRRFASPFIIAVLDRRAPGDVGELVLAGSSAVIESPYDAVTVWDLFHGPSPDQQERGRLVFGPLELDARAFSVTVDGRRLQDLPLKEFELLRALMDRAPEVVSNDELRLSVWGEGTGTILDNTLAVHVARLRSRLHGTARIRRLRGRGYALAVD
jgi:DNA-binding response OmpR family regulator